MSHSKQSHPHALVTGGAGFIGSHVVDALIEDGWLVTVVDDLSSGKRSNIHPAAKFLKMNIRDPKLAALVVKMKPDAILHFAAQINVRESIKNPIMDSETNIQASLRLMDAAVKAKVQRFVFAASGGVLCDETVPLPTKEHQVADPLNPYGIAKRTIEHYGNFYAREYKLPFVALRFANVYGPRQNAKGEAGVVSIFVTRMLANESVAVNGTGKQTRDFVYVGDVVSAAMAVLKKKQLAGPFHVGTGKETSIADLFKKIATIIGYKKKPKKGPADTSAPMRSALDSSLLQSVANWEPATSLADGLKNTVLAFQTEEKGKKVCLYPFRHLM